MSSELVGLMIFASIISLILWNYYTKEKKQNNFLIDRIKRLSNSSNKNEKISKQRMLIEKELEELNNPITYEKLINIRNFAMIFSIIIFALLNMIYIGLFSCLISFKIPNIYISLKKDEREKEFNEQLPDAINQLLAVLQSGKTARQGYGVLAEEASYPINIEFKKVYNDLNTGAKVEKALADFYNRNPSNDVKLFMIGMIIANNTSPQVAINTLKTISETIRQRDSQKKSAKSAIASGKYTAIILSLLPLFVFAGMETIMPDYINDFLSTFMGKIAFFIAFVLDGIGYLIARKVTSSSSIVKY